MCQFMCDDVKFKDFRKASIPKFDSSKNDSFVHWYKLFCSTCLQWGVWCPPYESAQEDSIHGKWWSWLPASVRKNDSFMSGLIYTALTQVSTFPSGSREQSAVEGCPPPSRVSCGVFVVSPPPPPPSLSVLDSQRNPSSTPHRTLQLVHSPPSGFHGTRTPSHTNVHRIRSTRSLCSQLDVRMAP